MDQLNPSRLHRAIALMLVLPCAMAFAEAQQESTIDHELRGYASWYAGKFQGRLTANGERFDTNELTAAHKTLPFNTIVEVLHIENGRTVTVRINDRGPFVEGRVIDLSRAAAEQLRMTAEGIAPVELTIIEEPVIMFTVQIASFTTRANATRLASRLEASGIPVSLEQAGTVTRVVVSDLEPDEVSAVEERLAELGHADPLVREQRE